MLRRTLQAMKGKRWISQTRVLRDGQTTMAKLVAATADSSIGSNRAPPTVDHYAPVQYAAQLMAELHVEALPVTRNDKVVGLLTERDYFDKVLNTSHQAAPSTRVCDVASMGPNLIVARPEDSVESCLEIMTKKNLLAIPVVKQNGHIMGTVSVMDLVKELVSSHHPQEVWAEQLDDALQFSEPSHFPENNTLPNGVLHDEFTASMRANEHFQSIYEQLKHDLEEKASRPTIDSTAAQQLHLDENLDELAAKSFSEASVFPEFTPQEDELLVQTHGNVDPEAVAASWKEDTHSLAEEILLQEAEKSFSEAADFPECTPQEEVVLVQTYGTPLPEDQLPVWKEDTHLANQGDLLTELEGKFSESSDFPEGTSLEESLMFRRKVVVSKPKAAVSKP